MTPTQKRLRDLRERQSRERQRMAELALADSLTDETRAELDQIENGTPDLERQLRAAQSAADVEEQEQRATPTGGNELDAEMRERIELRSRCRVGRYLLARHGGRIVDGAERELSEAARVDPGEIPLELWEPAPEQRSAEQRTVAALPGTTGINLAPIQPAVFAPSIAPSLSINMPRVGSGTYAIARISTSQSASALAKGTAAAGVAGAMTVATTTAHRVSARVEFAIEDIANVGTANFESALRQNLSMALSAQLDDYLINGDGTGANPGGLLKALSDPTAKTAVATFDDVVGVYADAVDGLWSMNVRDVFMLAGVATYWLFAKTFKSPVGTMAEGYAVAPSETAADWAEAKTGGLRTNERMPAAASDNQAAIVHRRGRSGLMTAVAPTWGSISIDDFYSGSAKGERYFTAHVLIGDLIVVQPGAYKEETFHIA